VSAFASSFFLGQSAGVFIGGLVVGVAGTPAFLVLGAAGVLAIGFGFASQLRAASRRAQPDGAR
jgi:hypothetical protein